MSFAARARRVVRGHRGLASAGQILLGSLIGQGALLAISPLLTRLYEPADFGALAVVTSISSVLGAFVTLSWERALIPVRSDRLARALATLAWTSSVILTVVTAAVMFALRSKLDDLLGTHVFHDLWWTVPATMGALAAQRNIAAVLTRSQRYGAIARRNMLQGFGQTAASVGLAWLPGGVGLVTAPIFGRVLAALGSSARGNRTSTAPDHTGRRRRDLVRIAGARYRRFPLISTWSSVVNALGLQLPSLLLAAAFGSEALGFLALALRIVATPVGIAADALAQVFDGALGKRVRERRPGAFPSTVAFVTALTGLAGLASLAVITVSPHAVPALFGESWIPSIDLIRLVVIMSAAQLIASPISRGLMLLGHQRLQLGWDVGRFSVTNLSILVVTNLGGGVEESLEAWVGASAVAYGILVTMTLVALRRRDIRVLAGSSA